MRKVKKTLWLSFALAFVLLLSACGQQAAGVAGVARKSYTEIPSLTKKTDIQLEEGAAFYDYGYSGDMFVIKKGSGATTLYGIGNFISGKVTTCKYKTIKNMGYGIACVSVEVDTEEKFGIINESDEKLLEFEYKTGEINLFVKERRLFIIAKEKLYEGKGGQIVLLHDYGQAAGVIPGSEFSYTYTDDYIFRISSGRCTVTDYSGNYVLTLPAGTGVSYYVLGNKTVLKQTLLGLPEDADDYDAYTYDSTLKAYLKYSLKTELIDVKSGKPKNVKFKYIIDSLTTRYNDAWDFNDYFNEKYKDSAYILGYDISGKFFSYGTEHEREMFVSSALKVQLVADPSMGFWTTYIADNRYFSYLANGDKVIIDNKSKIIATFDSAKYTINDDPQNGFIRVQRLSDNKYGFSDKDGKLIVPCEYGSIGQFNGGKAFGKKDGKYYTIDTSGVATERTVAAGETVLIASDYYYITGASGFKLYNNSGTELLSGKSYTTGIYCATVGYIGVKYQSADDKASICVLS